MLDKSTGLVLGSELVTNAGPFIYTTGWSSGQNAVLSVVSAKLRIAGNGTTTFPYGSFAFSSVVGRVYKFVGTVTYVSGTDAAFIQKAEGATGTTGFAGTTAGAIGTTKTITAYFSATTTTTQIQLVASAANSVYDWDNISVKELPGNHAVQATTANRPIYAIEPQGGRRNLLTWTEQFENASWVKTAASVPSTGGTAPDGTATADTLREDGTSNTHVAQQNPSVAALTAYTVSTYFKRDVGTRNAYIQVNNNVTGTGGACFAWFDLTGSGSASAVTDLVAGFTSTGASITPVGSGWYRCSVRLTTVSGTTSLGVFCGIYNAARSYTGDGTSGILIWGAQLELGSTATAYQRVTDQYNVTEAGVSSVSYLFFDGVNDSLATSTITPGVDKAQVFAGVRRLTNTAGVIAELSTDWNSSSGSFLFWGGTSMTSGLGNGFNSGSRGSANAIAEQAGISPTTFTPPVSAVLAAVHDIAGDFSSVRGNGVVGTNSTADKGTGNFLAHPLHIGARNGSSLFFSGHLYSLIARFGPNLATGQISSTETWVAGKTGVTI
jgi:hypothetical protein